MYIVFDEAGEPAYTIAVQDMSGPPKTPRTFKLPDGISHGEALQTLWYKGGIQKRTPCPGPFYAWDPNARRWAPKIDELLAEARQRVNSERDRRSALACDGFDATSASRERIASVLNRLARGDGLPAGWSGWRDAGNTMRWADDAPDVVMRHLQSLSRAIEDREQALLAASWQHKSAIAALAAEKDADALIAYDVTAGWPA